MTSNQIRTPGVALSKAQPTRCFFYFQRTIPFYHNGERLSSLFFTFLWLYRTRRTI